MRTIEEYRENGGLPGYARRILTEEMQRAENDENHPLRTAVVARQRGDHEAMGQHLYTALDHARRNQIPPLDLAATVFLTVPETQILLQYAEDQFDNPEIDLLPIEIVKMAGIGVGMRATKSAAGKKKGAKARERVIQEWEAYPHKEKKAAAFASRLFKDWGGDYDKHGNKIAPKGVPSEATIAGYVRDYINEKKNGVF